MKRPRCLAAAAGQRRGDGIAQITIEDRGAVADALHLALRIARSGRANGFLAFDRALARRAAALGACPRVDLLA